MLFVVVFSIPCVLGPCAGSKRRELLRRAVKVTTWSHPGNTFGFYVLGLLFL